MKSKLTPRELALVAATLAMAVFFLYWNIFLNPIIMKLDKNNQNINIAKNKLQAKLIQSANLATSKIKIMSKEDQLQYVINYLDHEVGRAGIKNMTLSQTSSDNRLTLRIGFVSTFPALLSFFDSLSHSDTLLILDSAQINQEGSGLTVSLQLVSGYH